MSFAKNKPRPSAAPAGSPALTRRSLLEWLGSGTVLALTSPLITACGTSQPSAKTDLGRGHEMSAPPPPGDGAPATDALPAGSFPFEEGEGDLAIYQDWGERTVDPQDLADILSSWELTVYGLVENAFTLSFAELVALPRQNQTTDFHCVEGWSILDVPWNGVHLQTLLDRAQAKANATHVTFHTVGHTYNESLPLSVALEPRTVLAYGIGGATLPLKHGFPLRLVVPRLFAYKSAKYVAEIELTDHATQGYWVKYGYPYDAEVPQDRLREGKY